MGCSTCSSGGGIPKGCKNNGTCGTSGCNKLTVFDWLENMVQPDGREPFSWVEVRFKNGRKDFFNNSGRLPLKIGDAVAVEANPGHDIGTVSLSGELVRLQMRKRGIKGLPEPQKQIYRQASQRDLDKWHDARNREYETMLGAREIAKRLNLQMKISDVEYQGDGSKATFYYTADDRVDFRQLIKELAQRFGIRVEMRQIGARQEAGRLGGIGSCGRELCCSTWLTDFRSVNTAAARYQQLSLNPIKLAGQCGKLKCCLNYELDSYLEAFKDFPDVNSVLQTEKGPARCQKIDIFKRIMWFSYDSEPLNWLQVPVERVQEIIAENKEGRKPASLEEIVADFLPEVPDFKQVDDDSLTRFDNKGNRGRKKRKPRNKRAGQNQPQGRQNQDRPKPSGTKQTQAKPRQEASKTQGNANKPGPQNSGNRPKKRRNNRNRNNKPRNEGNPGT